MHNRRLDPIKERQLHQNTFREFFSRREGSGVLFVLPAIIVIGLVIIYPIIYQVYLSFFKVSMFSPGPKFCGLGNYLDVIQRSDFRNAFGRTVVWATVCVFFQIILGFAAAIVFNEEFWGRGVFRGLVLIPWIVPTVIASSTWRWMYHADFGIINGLLHQLGLISTKVNWLGNLDLAMWAVAIVNIWKMFPFVMLMFLAALQAIPKELYEAAWIDGAGIIETFRYVTLPSTKAIRLTTTLLLIIWSLNSFTIPYVMTEGGPLNRLELMSLYVFRLMFKNYQDGEAAAVAMMLFAVMLLFTIIYIKSLYAKEEAQ